MDYLGSLSDWIVATPLSLYLQNLAAFVPMAQSVHIIAIAFVVSSAVMLNLRLAGVVMRDQSLVDMTRRFVPPTWAALVVLAISGIGLVTAEPARSLLTIQFQLKMVLLLVGIAATVLLQRSVSAHAAAWDRLAQPPASARLLAGGALLVWLIMIFAGRWIAYV